MDITTQSKNIRDMCRGIHKFKNSYQSRTNLLDKNFDLLGDPHKIGIGGGITSISYSVYINLMIVGR
jgi:hypothetical protein